MKKSASPAEPSFGGLPEYLQKEMEKLAKVAQQIQRHNQMLREETDDTVESGEELKYKNMLESVDPVPLKVLRRFEDKWWAKAAIIDYVGLVEIAIAAEDYQELSEYMQETTEPGSW